jgi:hypothetical protein
MTKTLPKMLLSGVAVAIVASFAMAASAQAMCAWPTMQGQCLPPPPGGSIIAYPAPLGSPLLGSLHSQAYVPGNFPGPDTVHLPQ